MKKSDCRDFKKSAEKNRCAYENLNSKLEKLDRREFRENFCKVLESRVLF